jgi:hypothetical protein
MKTAVCLKKMDVRFDEQERLRAVGRVIVDDEEAIDTEGAVMPDPARNAHGLVPNYGEEPDLGRTWTDRTSVEPVHIPFVGLTRR